MSIIEEGLSLAQRVTRQIEAALLRGVRPWVRPWDASGLSPMVLPLRANGIPYKGVNTLALWAAADERGFVSPFWLTFKQAQERGAYVRKGERGSFVVFYKQLTGEGDPTAATDPGRAKDAEGGRRILRGYVVFNADQVEGLPATLAEHSAPPAPRDEDYQRLSDLFARVPATTRYGGDRAFYAPGPDLVQLPPKAAFRDASQFWSTMAHELGHWTRHPTRLDRDFGQKRFGDQGYALEELVAELCSAFVGAHVGLPADHIEDHASYIASWLEALQSNPTAFLMAAGKAQAAADYLMEAMGVGPEARSPVAAMAM